jgi:hypothetical protein
MKIDWNMITGEFLIFAGGFKLAFWMLTLPLMGYFAMQRGWAYDFAMQTYTFLFGLILSGLMIYVGHGSINRSKEMKAARWKA